MRKIIFIMFLGITLYSCTNLNTKDKLSKKYNLIKQERDDLLNKLKQNKLNTDKSIASFLTFQNNNAEQAMMFYINLFNNSKIIEIQRYKKKELGKEGSIKMAKFMINGSLFICSDSYIKHNWDFTPAISIFIETKSDAEIQKLFKSLSKGGKIMMPLKNYGFSKKFGFIEDQFGISWQLNLK